MLAGFWSHSIEVDKHNKPKSIEWKALTKLLSNPNEFLKKLKDHVINIE